MSAFAFRMLSAGPLTRLSFAAPRRMTSITVLFNTSALFAYLLSVAFLGEAWAALKLTAVGLATVGVAIIAYGSAGDTGEGEDKKTHMLLGDMLSLAGAAA